MIQSHRMKKAHAIHLLGGTVAAAAKAIDCSYQAVNQWPDELPRRIEDRVVAALARQNPDISKLIEESNEEDANA